MILLILGGMRWFVSFAVYHVVAGDIAILLRTICISTTD